MYEYLYGTIAEKTLTTVIVDCGGVGYEVFATADCLEGLQVGKPAKIYVYLAVREDAMQLFGFLTRQQKQMFLQLISVSGIGARTAISVLSSIKLVDLVAAIANQDTAMLSKVKGIGKKTAERLVLELGDKLDGGEFSLGAPIAGGNHGEAIEALMSLGFPKNEATKMLSGIDTADKSVEQIVLLALKRK